MDKDTPVVTPEIVEDPTNKLSVVYTPATIEDNLAALEAYVDNQLEPFHGETVINPFDNAQVTQHRNLMAALNKLKQPIDDERKRIKREYEAPLKEFESRVKKITGKIDEARETIKREVDKADAAYKEARREELFEAYQNCAGILVDLISFDALLDPAWLRRSTSQTKAERELIDKVEKALKGYETLESTALTHKDEVVREYCTTLDLMGALKLEEDLKAEDEKKAEFKRAQEAVEKARTPEPLTVPEPAPAPEPVKSDGGYLYKWTLNLEFVGTHELAKEVGLFLKSKGLSGQIRNLGVAQND